jgi:hypothetical protein
LTLLLSAIEKLAPHSTPALSKCVPYNAPAQSKACQFPVSRSEDSAAWILYCPHRHCGVDWSSRLRLVGPVLRLDQVRRADGASAGPEHAHPRLRLPHCANRPEALLVRAGVRGGVGGYQLSTCCATSSSRL